MNRFRTLALTALSALSLAGCADVARLISPGGERDTRPAQVAFRAAVTTAATRTAADVVTLRVTASYLQGGSTKVLIGSQTLTLTSEASQAVPIPIDLATCLVDPNRDGATDSGCSVVLELSLVVNGNVVDRQTVGPLRLAPGATADVSQPVQLFEIASIDLAPAGDVALTLGGTQTLTPTVKDSRGTVVTGRAIAWSSDAPTVVAVDNNGKLTAVSVGTAHITASLDPLTKSITATVSKPPVALSLTPPTTGSGSGVVKSSPVGLDCRVAGTTLSGTCAFNFPADVQVILTSTVDAGNLFGSWGGACVANAVGQSCTLSMTQARAASVNFVAQRRVVITSSAADGRGRVTGDFGINCRIDGAAATGVCAADVPDGSPMTLASVPDAATADAVAQAFAGWGGDCASATGNSCTLTPTAGNRALTAGFFAGRTLTITTTGNGAGTVNGGTIACARSAAGATSGSCAQTITHGTVVTLSATTDAQSEFAGWSGGACNGSTASTCAVTMTQATSVTAAFRTRVVTLTVSVSGTGDGAVSVSGGQPCDYSNPAQGPVTCTRTFAVGTVVTLSANPGTRTRFDGWSGDCSGTSTCAVTMTQSRNVGASFSRRGVLLNMVLAGDDDGRVTVNGATACTRVEGTQNATCSQEVAAGTSVALVAVPSAQGDFTGWSGDCSGLSTACSLTMDADRTVTATFTKRPSTLFTLSVTGLLSGNGTVRSTEPTPVIDCTIAGGVKSGPRCEARVLVGTRITLQATGATSNALKSWGGACSGRSAFDCTFNVTADANVSAGFVPAIDVVMRVTGTGVGSVSFVPQGAPSQEPCMLSVPGTLVSCRFALPTTSSSGIFNGTALFGSRYDGIIGPCVEGAGAVPVCTYLGIGFVRIFNATFTTP